MDKQNIYWKETDYCIEHLIRLSKNLPCVKEWLLEHKDRLSCLSDFLKKYPEFPPKEVSSEVLLHKPKKKILMNNPRFGYHGTAEQPHGYVFSQIHPIRPYGLPIQDKLAYLEALTNDTVDEIDDGRSGDSDDDFESQNRNRWFKLKEVIDVQDGEFKWYRAQVKNVWDHYIYITYLGYKDDYDEWIDVQSPRVAPKGTFTIETHVSSDPDDDEMEGGEQSGETVSNYDN